MNTINWIVIPAQNLQQSVAFYSAVFGWKTNKYSENYYTFSAGSISGAFDAALQASVNSLTFSITVPSLNAALTAIVKAGCMVISGCQTISGIGQTATFQDPSGNHIELFCNTNPEE